MAALLLAWPFANLPFNDDWTWALTVKQLMLTGQLKYNGWSSPTVIAQAYWGLLWVKAFGFSFNVLRISTLPMAAGSVALTYVLGRRAELDGPLAAFLALTLGLSPLFMPMEASFMTDVPGLFFLLLSMYWLVRGYETGSIFWILMGALIALVGGSSRQLVWIVPLITLPYFAWLRRSDRAFMATACIAWIGVFVSALCMQHWFSQQPFSIPDPPSVSYLRELRRHPKTQVLSMFWVGLEMVLLLLPIAVAVFGRNPMRPRSQEQREGRREGEAPSPRLRGRTAESRNYRIVQICLSLGLFAAFLGMTHHYHRTMIPWMQNMITPTGVLSSAELSGDRQIVLIRPIRDAIGVVVLAATSMLISSAILWMVRSCGSVAEIVGFFLRPPERSIAVQAMVLTTVAYLGLEWTRCVFDVGFDRHLLPLIVFIGIPILLAFQQNGFVRMPVVCWAVLILFGIYAIASTQELNSLARARVTAIWRLRAKGVKDTQIDAGFEFDYWTEADEFGRINDARLRTPVGAYDKTKGPTPHLDFVYRLERGPTAITTPSSFGQIDYFSLLPPFHRTVWIDTFPDPARRPLSRQFLPKTLIDQYPM
jgi:hypothetical protein